MMPLPECQESLTICPPQTLLLQRLRIGGMDDPRNAPFPTCVTTPNLVVLGQTVWESVGGPKTFGDAGARPLRMGACLTPRNMRSPSANVPNPVALDQTAGT